MLTAATAYQNVSRNLTRALDGVVRSPAVARETNYYLAHIGKVKSIDDFVSNKRVLRYALDAFGLSDIAYAGGLVRRLLEGGVDKSDALANKLVDQKYRDFVSAFNFVRFGAATTSFDRTQKGTADRYAHNVLEENTGNLNEGARLALYFKRQSPGVSSALGLLADKALLKVTQTALGLPAAMSNLSLESQEKLIAAKLDVADLKDEAKLNKFLKNFVARWDANNPAAGNLSAVALDLSTSSVTIGADLLAAIQSIKRST